MPQPKSRKIAILGYRSVGKSSLTIQFVEGQFVDSYDPTIENTFTKMITINGQEYHLQLVDTAGQDEYSIFPQTYSIDINGYILVYSVTSNKSFEVVQVIHEKLLDMVGKVQVPIMLVGNKNDLHMERYVLMRTYIAHNAPRGRNKQNSTFLTYETKTKLQSRYGRGGFPEDDPGGREDGRRRAARKNILLHDVEPPNQHTGHCTGISRYLKASCQFSSTSADSTPHPLPQGPKYPILSIYGSESTVIYQYFLLPSVILGFLCVFDKRRMSGGSLV
ncbi:hypothetical protein INR49_017733 [Caranx melampygus]|nr:hypothetical protein INR49_017733 [Caranx melampygus]